MGDIRMCAVCDLLVTEDIDVAVRARKAGIRLAHEECAVLHASGLYKAMGQVLADHGFDRCRHRAGTVAGRCLDCGAAGV